MNCGLYNFSPLQLLLHLLQAPPEQSVILSWGKVMHETQGWWNNIHFTPEGKIPKWSGQATCHQTCSLYCLLFTDFDFTKWGWVQHLLKATETSPDLHLFSQRRGLVNAELPWAEGEVSGSSPELWRQKSNNKPWLGDKRENNAKLQGSWHRSPTKCSPRDRGTDLGPAKVSPTARPWPGHFPILRIREFNISDFPHNKLKNLTSQRRGFGFS